MGLEILFTALGVILALGFAGWLYSLYVKDVSFVDSLWSLFILIAALVYALAPDAPGTRGWLVLVLVAVWALRLSIYIAARNWGEPEDRRYRRIRENNQPFRIKSLYMVFGLQGVLAWVISVPLFAAITRGGEPGVLDALAVVLWSLGFVFEACGDYQLARFKRDPGNEGKVLDTGLWRYTRHPNYFGEFCIWWAFYLFAAAAGGWWTIFSPLLMSFLLLKVSGVSMLEKDIEERRPKYRDYIKKTNAFFPGPPDRSAAESGAGSS